MANLADDLIKHGMVHPNPSSKWACYALIVPNPGPAKWTFTVDLNPVNHFAIPYQYAMPRVEHDLMKTYGSKFYAKF